jgi:hypothetical protein
MTDKGEFAGKVTGGMLRLLSPPSLLGEYAQLTTRAREEAVSPETGIIDIRNYETLVIAVTGNFGGEWIYSAAVTEEAGPILSGLIDGLEGAAGGGAEDLLSRRVRALEAALGIWSQRIEEATRALRAALPLGETKYECGKWEAVLDQASGKEPNLTVRGSCLFPTTGFLAELRRHDPQGINPGILLLDLVVTKPAGPTAQVLTEVEVTYAEEGAYEAVTILPDGPTINVS